MALAVKKSELSAEMGHRVQTRRKELGISQDKLAEKAGLSSQYVACVEAGIKGLGCDSTIKLAQALRVSTDYILLGKFTFKEEGHILEIHQDLTTDEISDLKKVLEIFFRKREKS